MQSAQKPNCNKRKSPDMLRSRNCNWTWSFKITCLFSFRESWNKGYIKLQSPVDKACTNDQKPLSLDGR